MTGDLIRRIEAELSSPAPDAVVALAAALADPARDAAVLYYGSTLRTGDLSGILDFYRLTRRPHRNGFHGLIERAIWPEVSYHEIEIGGRTLLAKVATMPLATFRKAAEGRTLDTTIWARFVQPAQRVWSADPQAAQAAALAVAAAVTTAARFAAALGPEAAPADDFWLALFRKTYAAEFRVENTSRADTVMAAGGERYATILPLAWAEAGVDFKDEAGVLRPVKRGLPRLDIAEPAGQAAEHGADPEGGFHLRRRGPLRRLQDRAAHGHRDRRDALPRAPSVPGGARSLAGVTKTPARAGPRWRFERQSLSA